ncbi:MAG: hypothetical protein KDK65_00030 [Chlamydiia bacterium]|nr:hypothetical protein [Chlamydiia bacterium]
MNIRKGLVRWHKATSHTKWFVINWIIYMLIVIVGSFWCYARLDLVRTGKEYKQMERIQLK